LRPLAPSRLLPAWTRLWRSRIRAREFRSLALMIARTVVSWRAAIPETVSPERTVYVLDEELPAALPPAELEPPELLLPLELELLLPGMRRVWPMRIRAREFRSLALMIARTVVSWRAAIPETVSPERTV